MSINQTLFLISIGIKHLVEYPYTKTQEELEVSVLSSDFASVRFVNDEHSNLIIFKTTHCQYCKQSVHLKCYYKELGTIA